MSGDVLMDTRPPEATLSADQYRSVIVSLQREFADDIASETVEWCVALEAERVADARVRSFLEILVHKAARARLRALEREVEIRADHAVSDQVHANWHGPPGPGQPRSGVSHGGGADHDRALGGPVR